MNSNYEHSSTLLVHIKEVFALAVMLAPFKVLVMWQEKIRAKKRWYSLLMDIATDWIIFGCLSVCLVAATYGFVKWVVG